MAWTRKSCHVSGQKESDNFLDSKSVLQIFLVMIKNKLPQFVHILEMFLFVFEGVMRGS